MSKNIDISNNLYERKSTMPIHEEQISTKISEILSIYENGIQSIFDSPKRQNEENYLLLLFNCPNSFHEKYNQTTPNTLNNSMILQYFNNIEKKRLNPEIKNELEKSSMSSIFFKDNIKINIEEENNDYIIMHKKIIEKFYRTNKN